MSKIFKCHMDLLYLLYQTAEATIYFITQICVVSIRERLLINSSVY